MITILTFAVAAGQLKITDLKVGTGAVARKGDVIAVLYRGTLKNGKEFDGNIPAPGKSAEKPPYSFRLGDGRVIKGWDQGLVGMKVGGRRKLSIPAEMAYGAQANGDIPANSDLTFVVELLRVDNEKTTQKITTKDSKVGTGPAAKSGDTVSIFYTGKFLNGFVFDTNRGSSPYELKLGTGVVIKGFDQALMGMKKGGKRTVTIPYPLAYRENGRPPRVPGYATLVFDLEMMSIK